MFSAVLRLAVAWNPLGRYLAAPPLSSHSAISPPNPAPTPPPGLQGPVTTMVAWGKWGVLVCGVVGLLICAGKMAIGHRNRATFAADGATGIPWVLGGLSLAAVAAAIVGVFLG